jgi:hypothetical protein
MHWADATGNGDGTQDDPRNPAMPSWTLPESTGYPTIRPEFGLSRSGRSSARLINTDYEHAHACVLLTKGANKTLPAGLIAGRQYTVELWGRVSPSSGSMQLTVSAKDARCLNCLISNSTVLASGAVGSNFTSISAEFTSVINSTTLFVKQHAAGTVWLDDFTLMEVAKAAPRAYMKALHMKSDDRTLPTPTNYSVASVFPRWCPVGGLAADGKNGRNNPCAPSIAYH